MRLSFLFLFVFSSPVTSGGEIRKKTTYTSHLLSLRHWQMAGLMSRLVPIEIGWTIARKSGILPLCMQIPSCPISMSDGERSERPFVSLFSRPRSPHPSLSLTPSLLRLLSSHSSIYPILFSGVLHGRTLFIIDRSCNTIFAQIDDRLGLERASAQSGLVNSTTFTVADHLQPTAR